MRRLITISILSAILFANCKNDNDSTQELPAEIVKPGFFHNVYFYINPAATPEDIRNFETGLDELGTIEELIDYHIGKPAMTPREVVDNSYQYSIITSFKNKADHDAYQVHPIHDDFRTKIGGIVDSVRIYDSLIQ